MAVCGPLVVTRKVSSGMGQHFKGTVSWRWCHQVRVTPWCRRLVHSRSCHHLTGIYTTTLTLCLTLTPVLYYAHPHTNTCLHPHRHPLMFTLLQLIHHQAAYNPDPCSYCFLPTHHRHYPLTSSLHTNPMIAIPSSPSSLSSTEFVLRSCTQA